MACEYYYSLVAVILEYIVCFLLRLKLLLGRKGDIVGHVQWEGRGSLFLFCFFFY